MKVRLARRYALSLFRLAVELKSLYEAEEDLTFVERVFAQTDLEVFLSNPGVPTTVKKELIVHAFGPYVSGFVLNFLCYIVDKRRTNVLPEIIIAYRVLVREASCIVDVKVTTATQLAEQDKGQLVAQLATITGKTIELHEYVDQRIIGGLIIEIGDKRIDNSVVARLGTMKGHMLQQIVGGK